MVAKADGRTVATVIAEASFFGRATLRLQRGDRPHPTECTKPILLLPRGRLGRFRSCEPYARTSRLLTDVAFFAVAC